MEGIVDVIAPTARGDRPYGFAYIQTSIFVSARHLGPGRYGETMSSVGRYSERCGGAVLAGAFVGFPTWNVFGAPTRRAILTSWTLSTLRGMGDNVEVEKTFRAQITA